MILGALIAFMVTGLTGTLLLATWSGMGGHRRDVANPSRIPNPTVFTHVSLAVGAFVLWLFYVVLKVDAFAWITGIAIAFVIALGLRMFVRWLPHAHRGMAPTTSVGAAAADQELSVGAVAVHGVFAAVTALFVVLVLVRI
jgi:hypothetical protein